MYHVLELEDSLLLRCYFLSNFSIGLGFSSVQFSHSVMSDSLRPHESQQARPPCPSPTPGVHSNSRPSSQWCHPTISSSVVPFSSWPQSFQNHRTIHTQRKDTSSWGIRSPLILATSTPLPPSPPSLACWYHRSLPLHNWELDQCSSEKRGGWPLDVPQKLGSELPHTSS